MLSEAQVIIMLFIYFLISSSRLHLRIFDLQDTNACAFLLLARVRPPGVTATNQRASKSTFSCRNSEFWRRKRKRRKKKQMDRKMTEKVSRVPRIHAL